jgi:mannose-1-phosphate guanylyltransferase
MEVFKTPIKPAEWPRRTLALRWVRPHIGLLKGVVLCGGEGSRLRPLTYYVPKAMVPVGRSQRPLLEYIVRLLAMHGIRRIVLLVDYKANQIMNYFGDGERFGVKLTYIYDRPGRQGTAGALLNAYEEGAIEIGDELVIYYGDILSDIDLMKMCEEHGRAGASATLALARNYQVPVGTARTDKNGCVVELLEKPELDIAVTIAIMILKCSVINDIKSLAEGKKKLDLMGDVIPALIKSGRTVHSYMHDSFWYDVASMERYEKLDPEIVDRLLENTIQPLDRRINAVGIGKA